jgi:hypothetical protein
LSSLDAALAAHIIGGGGGSAKLFKLLSDHNVSDGIMQKRMDNEPEWIGVMQEFRVANLNRGCTFPQQCKPTNRNKGSSPDG